MSNSGSKKFNKWVAAVLMAILVLLLLSAALTVIIDPVFHYHAPLDGLPQGPLDAAVEREVRVDELDAVLGHVDGTDVEFSDNLV